ncbi:MAG: hypothetical protein JST32_07495 [Bacteroidetes bacterium]|nr:hypothetical protein [Bacteroidota bacterium]
MISLAAATVFFFINALFLQPYNKIFPSHVLVINEILFAIFALLLFKQMLLYPLQINIMKQGIFWFNTAVLFASATMFLNYALINYYFIHNINNVFLVYFWRLQDILFNVMLGIAVLTDKKESNSANAQQYSNN